MNTIIPPSEVERLAVVRRYDILDTPPDGAFDRITRIAARFFDVPIAIVSIVDHDRIWFKSRYGLAAEEIPRSPGLCASAILDNKPWVLTDAKVDPRSLTNPLVAGDFGLRFYAGVPLRTCDGFNLGTLCVIDREPRQVRDDELATLSDLGAIVMDELELRRSARKAVADREVLLKDVHHRVKNNLQVVSSLVALQRRSVPPDLRKYFDESLNRIQSIGRLHEKFYLGQNVETFDVATYLGELAETVIDSFGMTGRVSVQVQGGPIQIGLDTGTPLALLVAEVITNSCKHAFPDDRTGEINIEAQETSGQLHLQIRDNGVGMPLEQEPDTSSMGHRLITNFVQQLNGTYRFVNDAGTLFDLSCPMSGGQRTQ